MTKLTFVAAALVAAAAYMTEAASARSNPPARNAQMTAATGAVGGCVRAPKAGAFASAPYSVPPCMPNQAN